MASHNLGSRANIGRRCGVAWSPCGRRCIDLHGRLATSDPYDPAAVRASMGSLFSQKLTRCPPREFTSWAKFNGVVVVGSSPAGLLDYKAIRCRWPAALLIGSEKRGLSEHLAETADFMVRIPMSGTCDSINVSVAVGVLLFELSNQRKRAPK